MGIDPDFVGKRLPVRTTDKVKPAVTAPKADPAHQLRTRHKNDGFEDRNPYYGTITGDPAPQPKNPTDKHNAAHEYGEATREYAKHKVADGVRGATEIGDTVWNDGVVPAYTTVQPPTKHVVVDVIGGGIRNGLTAAKDFIGGFTGWWG